MSKSIKTAAAKPVKSVKSAPAVVTPEVFEIVDYHAPEVDCFIGYDNQAVSFFSFLKLIKTIVVSVFKNRGTGKTVALAIYGRLNTFTRAIAHEIATVGLNESEYIHIAETFSADTKRFLAYIKFYRKEGFNVVLRDGRYIEA
jgi:hypothetical protein